MFTKLKYAATTAAIAASALALAACGGGGTTQGAAPEQELQFGLSGDVPKLQPHLDQGAAAMVLDSVLHRGLLGYDSKGEITTALADKYEQTDPTTYKFTLHKGLTFHDGSPLTSAEVKTSFEDLANPKSSAKIVAVTQGISSIETPDAETVIIKLKSPNAAFLSYIADTTAAVLPPAAFTAGGESWVGAGPFKLASHDKGVSFVVEKFDGYYNAESVKLNKIDFPIYTDGQARTNALLAGDVDLIDFVPWEEFDRVKSDSNITLDAQSGPFMYLNFNVTKGPFADAKVREAVALAVNRENVVSAALSGNGTPIQGVPVPETSPFYNKSLANGWEQNAEKAKSLLAEAGYPDGFTARMLSTSQYAFHKDTALSVQSDLAAVGIKLDLDLPDWATRVSKGNAGDYDIAVSGSAGVVNDPSFLSKFVQGPAEHTRSFGYDNATINALLAKGVAETDEAKRKAVYDELSETILTDAPFVSLAGRAQAFAYQKSVTGFANLPGFLTFNSGYTLTETSLVSP
jgi:ABC-type transport system substrate-binding protein